MDTYTASDLDIRAVDHNMLVDIRNVKVNGKYVVRVSFADTDISLEDRLEAYIRTKG